MAEFYEVNITGHKPWKKVLCIILSIIIAFGTFVTITFGNSKFQKWLGVRSMLSAYAAEIVDTKGAIAVDEDAMIADDHTICLENRDGSNTVYLFSEPISYTDENGDIKTKDISVEKADNELKSKGYDYTNGQNDYRINFSKDQRKGIEAIFEDCSYSIIPLSTTTAEGTESVAEYLDENFEVFQYKNIYGNGTNLRFYPQLNGVKDEIILNQNINMNSFSFELKTKNCTAQLNGNGTISLINSDGSTIQTFAAPFAYDSEYVEGDINSHYIDCEYSLTKKNNTSYIMTITVPNEWLISESTQYPVIIDPTTSNISASADAGVYSKYSSNNYGSEQTCCFGRSSDYGYGSVYTKFTVPSAIKKGAKINSAYQWMRETTGRTTTTYVTPYMVKSSWTETGIKWTGKPAYNTSVAGTKKNINSKSKDDPDNSYWYKFNIANAVKKWVDGTANYGVAYVSSDANSSGAYNWRAFTARNYSSSAMRPYTVINYTNDTIAPTATVSKSPTTWTNGNVTVSISGESDNSGGAGLHSTPFSFSTTSGSYSWGTTKSKSYSSNCTVYVSVRDAAIPNIKTYTLGITNIDKLKPGTPTVTGNPSGWTKDDVTLTVKSTDAAATSTNGKSGVKYYCYTKTKNSYGTWQSVNTTDTATTFNISSNGTYYFYSKDQAGNISDPATVTVNIDKAKPIISNVDVSKNADTGKAIVTVTAEDALSGIAGYSFDGGSEWCNEKSFEFEKTSNSISVAVMDNAGNIADEITELKNPKFYSDNGLVGIYDPNSTNYEIEYKISNDGTWFDYTEPFAVPINGGNVYARFKDSKISVSKSFSSNVLEKLSKYTEQNVDLTIKNNDADFSIIRTYDSSTNDWFFSTQSNITVIENENVYSVKLPDSTTAVFVKNKNNTYKSPITDYTLIIDEDKYIVELDDQELLYNKTTGRLLSVNNKNHSVNLIYDNTGDLVEINAKETVLDNNIEEHKYIVDESNGKIRSIKDPLNQELIYTYDDNNNLTKVYYKGSTIQYKRNIDENNYMDIVLSEYLYDNNKLSFSNKSSINYSENKLSSIILPTGETTNYTFKTKKFNSYDIDNVSDDFDVIEVKVNDDITCYNYQSLPVIEISGNNAFVYTYDEAGELLEKTEYKKSGDSYVKVENEDESSVNSEDDSQDELPESSDSGESATDEEDPVVTTSVEDGKTTTEKTYYDEHGRVSSVETVVTKTADNTEISREKTEYTYFDESEDISKTVVTTTENGKTTKTTTEYEAPEKESSIEIVVTKTADNTEISREKTEYTYFGESEDISKTVVTTTESGVTITNTTEYYSDGKIHIEDTVTKKANKSNETKIIYTYTPFGNIETVNTLIYRDSDIYSASNYKYFYDALNRNTKIVSIDGNQDETLVSEYKYNPLGNIIYQNENGVVTRFIYDEYSRLVQQINKKDYNASNDGLNNSESSLDNYSNEDVGYRYKYSDDGNLEYEINDIGIRTDYTYHDNTSVVKTETFDIYQFIYETNGDIKEIKINGVTTVSYTYQNATKNDMEYRLVLESYANGDTIYNYYDIDTDNIVGISHNADGPFYVTYTYNDDGDLIEKENTDTGLKYVYDGDNVSVYKTSDNSLVQSYTSTENEANEETGAQAYKTVTENHFGTEYTSVSREKSVSYTAGTNTTEYSYQTSGTDEDERLSADTVKYNDNVILSSAYTYDDNGNVLSKSYGENNSIVNTYDDKDRITSTSYAGKTYNYTYYNDSQLTDVIGNNYTASYTYDSRGNITSKTVNDETTSFTYANSGWKDQLISVNGTKLTYDANGNVLTYGDKEFTWNTGRNLASITDGTNTYSYTYDENGIRTSKTVSGVTTYYNTKDGVILSQTDGTNNWYFQYDTNGTPLGFVLNGAQYFYITNQMNDVLAITDTSGTIVGNYEYDAWGKVLIADTSIAQQNPLRYRGYYYDNETGYYYLQSRYYDPSICRFINADVPEIVQMSKDISAGTNLFAYCCNDAVNNSDPTGFISRMNAAISIVIFVVFYIAEKVLKLSSKYKIECKKVIVDRMGNYIAKITYYKNKFNKKHFVLALGDKNSWNNAKNLSNHLNKDFINNQANYIQSEYNKGATTSLTNSGPNVYGVTIASASLAIYLLAKGIPTITIKKYYWLVWGDHNRYFSDRILYYLFNITNGGKKLNGWYLFRPSDGEVLKL